MKLPEQLLYEPRHTKGGDKVTDKALTRSIVISVIGILFCMTCLIGLTWAWFSSSIATGSNKITSATFDLDITVTEQESGETVTADENGYYLLEDEKAYTVTLVKCGTAKAGFCHMAVVTPANDAATAYYSSQIEKTGEGEPEPFIFTVSGVSKIKFTPMWGECPKDQTDKIISNNGKLPPGAKTDTKKSSGETENQAEETTPTSQPDTPQTTQSTETTAPSTETTTTEPTEPTGTTQTTDTTEPTDIPETQTTEPTKSTAQTEPTAI